jgi:hypothetical protein
MHKLRKLCFIRSSLLICLATMSTACPVLLRSLPIGCVCATRYDKLSANYLAFVHAHRSGYGCVLMRVHALGNVA